MRSQKVLPHIAKGGPEQRAIEAGEIDAILDHPSGNVILLPAARRALREAAELRDAAKQDSTANSVLAGLPFKDYRGVQDGLEPVTLAYGTVLYEPGVPIAHAYFPVDCVVSLLATVETRQAIEVGLVGREGMLGVSLVLETDVFPVRAVVQAAGTALRMTAAQLRDHYQHCPPLQRELWRYAGSALVQARQIIACNHLHSVEQRVARRLLMTADRVRSEEFFLTQAFLAEMLGARRAGVNEAASALQRRKLISYSRGRIAILQRSGLEAAACGCYARLKRLR